MIWINSLIYQVNLEKNEHRWWDCLFTGDPPINVKTLDTAVSTSELSQEDHMKIEELIAGQDKRQSVSTIPNVIWYSLSTTYYYVAVQLIILVNFNYLFFSETWKNDGTSLEEGRFSSTWSLPGWFEKHRVRQLKLIVSNAKFHVSVVFY